MRYPLAALFVALGCAADPVLLPDAGPCNGSCGAGTVCVAGACVGGDGGPLDAPAVDVGGGMDAQSATDVPDVFVRPDGSPLVDQGVDAGPVDVADGGRCPNGTRAMCDGRYVMLTTGESDGGVVHFCGACEVTCASGEVCDSCRCAR